MKRIPVINEIACGQKITGIRYMAEPASDLWVICRHGIGEVGPLDGSQLAKVEVHGYPQHIKNGLELPFNVFALQAPVQNYNSYSKVILPHLELFYGAEAIADTGLSMGGIATYNMLWLDQYLKLQCIVPVCGVPSYKDYNTARKIPILAVHGELDTTVKFSAGVTAARALVEVNTNVNFTPLPGVKHDAWVQAYDVNGVVGKEVLDFILHNLLAATTDYERGYADAKAKIVKVIGEI